MKISKIKVPNTFIIISSMIVLMAALTWIIPGGRYETAEMDGRETVIPDSFEYVASNPQNAGDMLIAPIRGFVDAALIIVFVLIVGGAFSVLQKTDALNSAIKAVASAHGRSHLVRMLLIPIFMTLFSLGGAVFGMAEETIPLVLIFIPLALTCGYDSIVGVAIPFVGSGAGFAGAFLNPFTVGIAQGIAEVPLFSGIEYRFIVWLVTTTVAITFVMVYAARIKRRPELSPVYESDEKRRESLSIGEIERFEGFSRRHKWVLLTFAAAMLILVVGVLQFHWYIEEIAALFLAAGIAMGIVGGLSANGIADGFISGARDLVATAIIIGLARGILIVAKQGMIIDTMLHTLAGYVGQLGPVLSAQAMFVTQTFINFFVPSGSGQAALTMPIMAPLSDLVGVSRQTAVLAFQLGDGFTNLIVPTSAVLMGILTLGGIPWEKWARWILPLQLILLVVGFLLLIPPFLINW